MGQARETRARVVIDREVFGLEVLESSSLVYPRDRISSNCRMVLLS